ncbi:universal stress protein [Cytobacillus sp. S13-E01]|uniref:universal stress protein n=1 Tax=Cytobacillus sp. S13-E01 TaxID=3031326 RepID=UPI0023D8354F|nr:universal stress protein [Cytobacillus sp. S13-E01]MDF0727288.1 universal stress protein [Cytobacillus sp. S13-E01]
MFKKILVASDGSVHSFRAAEKAIELAKIDSESKINVLYVVDGNHSKHDILRNWDLGEVSEQRQGKLRTIEEKAKEAGVNYEIIIIRGEPVQKILQLAKELQTDVIVLGSRGLNVLQEMVLGSVSHQVAKKAKCPVMIVK